MPQTSNIVIPIKSDRVETFFSKILESYKAQRA
jgi:hypothetical protein